MRRGAAGSRLQPGPPSPRSGAETRGATCAPTPSAARSSQGRGKTAPETAKPRKPFWILCCPPSPHVPFLACAGGQDFKCTPLFFFFFFGSLVGADPGEGAGSSVRTGSPAQGGPFFGCLGRCLAGNSRVHALHEQLSPAAPGLPPALVPNVPPG